MCEVMREVMREVVRAPSPDVNFQTLINMALILVFRKVYVVYGDCSK